MILVSSLFLFVWEFWFRHPGIVLVVCGVIGEVACDWKEMGGRLATAKKLSALLLIVGLLLEFWEAAKSDKEVSAALERAGNAEKASSDAELAATQLEMKVEELRQKNDALEAQVEPRYVKDWIQASKELEPYAGMRAIIFLNEGDTESRDVASSIYSVLVRARWLVTVEYFQINEPGVGIGTSPATGLAPQGMNDAAASLRRELISSGVWVTLCTFAPDKITFKGLVIEVGRKPSPTDAEMLKVVDESISPNHPLTSKERQSLDERFGQLELEQRKRGVVPMNFIPASAFPPQ